MTGHFDFHAPIAIAKSHLRNLRCRCGVCAALGPALSVCTFGSFQISEPAKDSDIAKSNPAVAHAFADSNDDETAGSAITIQFNLDYTTQYFFRGILQEDTGLILQPAARLTLNLFENDAMELDLFGSVWNSLHGQETGESVRGDFMEYWYESDLTAGATVTVDRFLFTAAYLFYISPNDAFETVQELDFTFAVDDSEWLGSWALHPYVMVAVETGDDFSDGAHAHRGTYLELGVAPGFTLDVATTPIPISFPVSVGLSLDDYYEHPATGHDEMFGFLQIGARASIPLGKPGRFGAWTLNAGASGLFLGDSTDDFNTGDDAEVIGTVGLQWNF